MADPTNPLSAFAGTYPYASELFGVYQPLLGWKGHRKQQRLQIEQIGVLKAVLAGMNADSRVGAALAANAAPFAPTTILPARQPAWLRSKALDAVQGAATQFSERQNRAPTPAELASLVSTTDLHGPIAAMGAQSAAAVRSLETLGGAANPQTAIRAASPFVVHEAVVAGTMAYLSKQAPSVLHALAVGQASRWQTLLPFVDPLTQFDVKAQNAYLSPIGMIHMYREYFFELDTFLGPPVGHVWVSPGGSLEVYEVRTTRQAQERSVEQTNETTTRTETAMENQDDLSTAVSKDNSQNMSLGVTASAGVNAGVFQASATASFNQSDAQNIAQQDAHKQSRTQSQKLSNEIRNTFKTTFKTSLAQEDTTSRRYVLSNSTDKLVNYELRRKMRKVAVQVQHIGTQLCWQVYVDDPGRSLGIAELVHVASPEDTSGNQPPQAPQPLMPQTLPLSVTFQFQGVGDNDDRSDDYIDGWEDPSDHSSHQIKNTMTVKVVPPATGYALTDAQVQNYTGPDPSKHPTATASFQIAPDHFVIKLDHVNFDDQPYLVFNLNVIFTATEPNPPMGDYEAQKAAYDAAQRKAAHDNYVSEVRSRVEAAGAVPKRVEDDLREEERSVVYRQLIQQLMQPAAGQTPHVASELVRSIFDIDAMLYFVAPDWWMPREHVTQSVKQATSPLPSASTMLPAITGGLRLTEAALGAAVASTGGAASTTPVDAVTAADTISWGGAKESGRDNYYVTENSAPAARGASLGWLLQLDGDDRRNAFLNAPWVKAVIPIRPGHEQAAVSWLQQAHVEGSDGLDAVIQPGSGMPAQVKTLGDAINYLASQIEANSSIDNTLATETVFETGFDPLPGGFKAVPLGVFDQWLEILPTDQIVALDYTPKTDGLG